MQLNVKFLVISMLLAIAAGLTRLDSIRVGLIQYVTTEFYTALIFALGPVGLFLGVLLPFIVVYILAKEVEGEQPFRAVIVSVFLGCWLGGATMILLDQAVLTLRGSTYLTMFYLPWVVWSVVAVAFNTTFFVVLSAVLFAYFRKTSSQPPQPVTTEQPTA